MVNIFYAGKVAGFSIDFLSNHRYQRDGAVPLQHVQHLSVPQGQKHFQELPRRLDSPEVSNIPTRLGRVGKGWEGFSHLLVVVTPLRTISQQSNPHGPSESRTLSLQL